MGTPRDWATLERLPAPQLRAVQDAALRRFVREELYPFSAHYRRVFDEARVRPESIARIADLQRLPLTTKQDLLRAQSTPQTRYDFVLRPSPDRIRAHWPFLRKLALVLGGARAREALRFQYTPNFLTFTTGRSSEPVGFAYTPFDLQVLQQGIARMFDIAGLDPARDRLVNLFPFAPHLAFWAVTLGGFETGALVVPSGGGKVMGTDGSLRLIERMKPTVLVGTPGFTYHVLRRGNELGTSFADVHTVILGAEKVPPGLKDKLLEALRTGGAAAVRIIGTYGFTEARMAWAECPSADNHSTGYHLHPDLGVFEVIEPKSGAVVPDGEDGELVYTGILGHGTCVLRYRTGDLCVGGLTWKPCSSCGRTLPRIGAELRRVSEQHSLSLTKVKGTLVDLSVMGSVLAAMRDVEEWQVVISKRNDDPLELDQLEVRVAPRAGANADELVKSIRRDLANATEVAPNEVHVLTLHEMLEHLGMESAMKEKRFLDRRPKS
ncbi:MAG: phenylacetate--CoA ligase [Planctomycetes bacterium]|nr:phenylacetate--CoA ligase [Planctomycetota bacterium]